MYAKGLQNQDSLVATNEKEEVANQIKTRKAKLQIFQSIQKYSEYLESAALTPIQKCSETFRGIRKYSFPNPCTQRLQETLTLCQRCSCFPKY